MPDGPKKEGLVEVIASYMKLAYKTWNKEHYVSDDIVKEDLVLLSDGQLELHEGHNSLDTLSVYAHKQGKERSATTQRGKGSANNKRSSGSSSTNRSKRPTERSAAGSSNKGTGNYRRKR